MSDFSIRLARAEDAQAFHRVEEDAAALFAGEPAMKGIPIPPSTSADDYARIIARRRSLTALCDGEVIGFAAVAPMGRELHLEEMSVARAFQGRGVGKTLLNAVKVDARNSGYRAITLSTFREIAWNAPFYARQGFVEVQSFEGRDYLQQSLAHAVDLGIPAQSRCAMIAFLD